MMPMDDPFASIQTLVKAQRDAEVPDIIVPTVVERFVAAIEKTFGPLPPARPLTGADIRRACRFCQGHGCLNCDALAAAEYKRQFPDGPRLLARFQLNDPEDCALVRRMLEAPTAHALLDRLRDAIILQDTLEQADREAMP